MIVLEIFMLIGQHQDPYQPWDMVRVG